MRELFNVYLAMAERSSALICVLIADSSECGFESRGAYVLDKDTLP